MDTRSSNAGIHISNDIVSNVGSSHGVQLTGGSTGGIVQAIGDDANVSLSVLGRGTGGVTIGNSSQAVTVSQLTASSVTISTGGVLQVGSTAPFAGFIRMSTDITTPNLTSTDAAAGISTVTVAGLNSSHFPYVISPNLSTALGIVNAWCSSAAELKVEFGKFSTAAAGNSTVTLNILVFRF